MTDQEIQFSKELAEHQLQDLPKNVFDFMHRPSFIAGFIRAIAVSQSALKTVKTARTSWVYCDDVMPTKSGRYYVAETINGRRLVTTRRFYKKTGRWADGKWKSAQNVYAWMSMEPPMKKEEIENEKT